MPPAPVKPRTANPPPAPENAAPSFETGVSSFETRFRDAILRIAPQPLLRMKGGKVVGTTLFFILRRPLRRREAPSRNGRRRTKDARLEGRILPGRIGRARSRLAPACARVAAALPSALPPERRTPYAGDAKFTGARGPGGCGEVPEWSNGAVSKTVVRFAYRGFESHPLRHPIRQNGSFTRVSADRVSIHPTIQPTRTDCRDQKFWRRARICRAGRLNPQFNNSNILIEFSEWNSEIRGQRETGSAGLPALRRRLEAPAAPDAPPLRARRVRPVSVHAAADAIAVSRRMFGDRAQ